MSEQATNPFSDAERRVVAALAAMVIPASAEHGVPGANDPAIVDNILADASRRPEQLRAALQALEAVAQAKLNTPFADLADDQRDTVTNAFRGAHEGHANLVANLTVQGYYRDDRVMRSIGIDPRPPHPLGYEVEQGDWSLLEPVQGRAPFYRPAD